MALANDILLDDTAFATAAASMQELKTRTDSLKAELESMYTILTTALDTPTGKQLNLTAENVLLKPIDDFLLVIEHTSATLNMANEQRYYKGIFVEYEEINEAMSF